MSSDTLADAQNWDRLAEQYETTAQPFTAQFAEVALARAALRPNADVLDVATGTGALALAAARAGAQVLAVDFSPGMVRRVNSHGVANLLARTMDGQALDLPDASFDAVFSIFGVFLFPDWRAGLAEMVRVTRPGGRVVVTSWQSAGGGPNILLTHAIDRLFPDLPLPSMPEGVAELSDATRLVGALEAAGLTAASCEPLTIDFKVPRTSFHDPDAMFAYSPQWSALDEERRHELVADLRRRVAEMPGPKDIAIPSTGLIALGTC